MWFKPPISAKVNSLEEPFALGGAVRSLIAILFCFEKSTVLTSRYFVAFAVLKILGDVKTSSSSLSEPTTIFVSFSSSLISPA